MVNRKNKGFTLVELIVVLVILAILAAILVPALLGYIDRAKSQQDLLNAKNVYIAAQSVASEEYANPTVWSTLPSHNGKTYVAITNVSTQGAKQNGTSDFSKAYTRNAKKVYDLCDGNSLGEFSAVAVMDHGKVEGVYYRNEETHMLTYLVKDSKSWKNEVYDKDSWFANNEYVKAIPGIVGSLNWNGGTMWYNPNR